MLMASGFLARVFEVFERYHTPVDLIATSEVSVSLTIDNVEHLPEIKAELAKLGEVRILREMAIVALVGRGFFRYAGRRGRIFDALSDVNVVMISFAASDVNVSVVVEEADAERAVHALHREFFGDSGLGRGTGAAPAVHGVRAPAAPTGARGSRVRRSVGEVRGSSSRPFDSPSVVLPETDQARRVQGRQAGSSDPPNRSPPREILTPPSPGPRPSGSASAGSIPAADSSPSPAPGVRIEPTPACSSSRSHRQPSRPQPPRIRGTIGVSSRSDHPVDAAPRVGRRDRRPGGKRSHMEHVPGPRAQGLYDPTLRARLLRRRLRRRRQRPQVARDRRAGGAGAAQPRAPRRLRLREEHRRRRRHPDADAARASSRTACDEARHRAARGPGATASASSSCPPTPRPPPLRGALRARSRAEEGAPVLGWRTCRPTTRRSARRPAPASPSSARSSSAAPRVRSRTTSPSSASSTSSAGAIENAVRASDIPGKRHLLRPQPVAPDARLQGHADRAAAAAVLPRPRATRASSRRWRWSTRASAPTPSRAGRAPTRTASSATTARSTRCAATSTGCTPARACSSRSCSATTSQKILPVIDTDGSDSAMFDNVLELLVLAGRSLPHAMMMMIPEPWAEPRVA